MPSGGLGPDNILNAALATFLAAAQAYFPLLLIWGTRILQSFTLLGLGYYLVQAWVKASWMDAFMAMGYAMIRLALLQAAMINISVLGSMFPTMGLVVGQTVSGQSPAVLTPSGFYTLGITIAGQLLKARHFGSWFNLIADAEFVLLIVACQIIWFSAAAIYLWTQFECLWLWVKGPIVVCFSAFDYTWMTFTSWFVQLLRIGVKLCATLLILAIGLTVAAQWNSWLAGVGIAINSNQIQYGIIELVEALIMFYAVWTQPARICGMIVGGGAGGLANDGEGAERAFEATRETIRKATRAGVTGDVMKAI